MIEDQLLDSIVYLYPSQSSAEKGEKIWGFRLRPVGSSGENLIHFIPRFALTF
jgi:hypothetical protein